MKYSIKLFFFLISLLVCSGCFGGKKDRNSLSWDACQILELGEAEELMNSKAESSGNTVSGVAGERPYVTQCHYHTLPGVNPYQSLGILFRLATNSEGSEGARERYVESLSSSKVGGNSGALERIDEIGNGALYDAERHQLIVFRGADMLILTGNLARKQDVRAEFILLANKLLSKLA